MADDRPADSMVAAELPLSARYSQPPSITWLARSLLVGAMVVVAVAVLLSSTQMAALRRGWPWLSHMISQVEVLWPGVDMVHALMFGAVGLLGALAFPTWQFGRLLLAIVVLAVVSEFVQVWIPGRTASLGEALLDVAAGAMGIGFVVGARWVGRLPGVLRAARGCFLAGVLLLPVQMLFVFWLAGHGLLLSDVLFALAIGLRGLAWLGGGAPIRLHAVHGGWLAYVLVLGIACLVSPTFASSAGKWLGVVYLALLAVLALDLASDLRFARRLVIACVAAAGVTALFSILAAAGFYLAPGSPWVVPLLSHYGSLPPGPYPRVNSLFANANMLCNYLVVAICLLLAAVRLGWIGARPGWLLFAMLSVAALLTISPGLGGLALALGAWCWWSMRERAPGLAWAGLSAGVLVAAATLLAVVGVNPAAPVGEPSVRWLIWQDAWETWRQHPWFGAGLGQDVVGVAYVAPSGEEQWLTNAHNVWLNLAGQAGLAAVVAMLVVCVLLLRGKWPAAGEGTDAAGTLRMACGIAFVAAFLYQGLVGSFEDARHLWLLMGLMVAVAAGGRASGDFRCTSSTAE